MTVGVFLSPVISGVGTPYVASLGFQHGHNANTVQVPCETALQAACVNGSRALEIVRLLVRRGATINTRGEGCGTPLQAAAAGGHGGAVGFLLEHGAKAEIQYRIDISIVRAGRV